MKLQFTPEELLSLYKSLILDLDQDESTTALLEKVEASILHCLSRQEDAATLGAFESWVESEKQKISTLKNELDEITKGALLVEKKSAKTAPSKSLPKRGRPKKD